jgi:polysaccharide biosynthesis protein PslG
MRHSRIFLLCLILLLSFSMGSVLAQESTDAPEETEEAETATPEATEAPEVEGGTYTVQAGENLFRIALRFGLTTQELAEANGITNPNLIFTGQRLIIPGVDEATVTPTPTVTEEPEEAASEEPETTATPAPEGEGGTYVVVAGDTLFRIAIRNNTTVATLVSLNDIDNPNLIFVGQRLTLPSGSPDASATEEAGEEDDGEEPDDEESGAVEPLEVEFAAGIEVFLDDDPAVLLSQVSQLNLDWVKITVDWAAIETEEGELDFAQLDAAVNAYSEAGLDVLLVLTGAPDWSRPSATELALEQPTYGPPDDLDTFGTFAGAVAEQYAGKVQAYEIWFQPNNRLTWMTTTVNLRSDGFPDARLSSVRYIDLLEVAYNAIKAADEDALVLTAGLAPTGNNDFYNSIDNFVFFEELLKQGALNFSDGIAVHVDGFSNPPDEECCGEADEDPAYDESYHFFFNDTLNNYREILDRNGGSGEALWVTRFGWGTAEGALGEPSAEAGFIGLNTAQEQADYTVAALEIGEERGDIGAMILFNLNGCAVGDTNACFYSVIDSTGAARPVFGAVQGE